MKDDGTEIRTKGREKKITHKLYFQRKDLSTWACMIFKRKDTFNERKLRNQ